MSFDKKTPVTRWQCPICKCKKFTVPQQPHRCNGKLRDKFPTFRPVRPKYTPSKLMIEKMKAKQAEKERLKNQPQVDQ